jgi:hypothetical protein
MTEKIKEMIELMTIDEMKKRLAEYMAADQQLAPRPIAVEVRLSNINNVRCRYDVLLIAENGQETEVKFRDRCSRLLYIYTLLHPQGYQRRLAAANNYKALRNLYTMLYFRVTSFSRQRDTYKNPLIGITNKLIWPETINFGPRLVTKYSKQYEYQKKSIPQTPQT